MVLRKGPRHAGFLARRPPGFDSDVSALCGFSFFAAGILLFGITGSKSDATEGRCEASKVFFQMMAFNFFFSTLAVTIMIQHYAEKRQVEKWYLLLPKALIDIGVILFFVALHFAVAAQLDVSCDSEPHSKSAMKCLFWVTLVFSFSLSICLPLLVGAWLKWFAYHLTPPRPNEKKYKLSGVQAAQAAILYFGTTAAFAGIVVLSVVTDAECTTIGRNATAPVQILCNLRGNKTF
jgi:hypothetical protein